MDSSHEWSLPNIRRNVITSSWLTNRWAWFNNTHSMSFKRTVAGSVLVWIVVITAAHLTLNLQLPRYLGAKQESQAQQKFRVGFIPVPCHLPCMKPTRNFCC